MTFDEEQRFVSEVKFYVSNNLELNRLSDDDLEEEIEAVVGDKLGGQYCTVEQRLSIVRQVYSSIRGFGLLDNIMADDTITEVMINGKNNIFI
ncbi:MAG: CpaF family protein, partial [Coprococcus sp.]